VELDETLQNGGPQLYLGILQLLRPPSLGGVPDQGRAHLERAIELSGGRNLTAKVELAKRYARTLYDRELHDKLLQEVLAADPEAEGLTLFNWPRKKPANCSPRRTNTFDDGVAKSPSYGVTVVFQDLDIADVCLRP